eukprot:COSAG02_NODE_5424_length_4343_cov_4.780160_3_plen_78_part_00
MVRLSLIVCYWFHCRASGLLQLSEQRVFRYLLEVHHQAWNLWRVHQQNRTHTIESMKKYSLKLDTRLHSTSRMRTDV